MKRILLYPILLLSFNISAQPTLVEDIMQGPLSATPSHLTVFKGELFFFANDGYYGHEFWRLNKQKAVITENIYHGSVDAAPNFAEKRMAELNGKLYFTADNGSTGLELFSFDWGQLALVSDIRGGAMGSDIEELVALNGKLYFNANNGVFGNELWEYDPAKKKAECVSFINTGAESSDPKWLTPMNNKLYFTAYKPATGRELYEYNPASGSTTLIADMYSGSSGSDPASLTNYKNKLYFTAATANEGRELHCYDGNTIQLLADHNPGSTDGCTADVNGQVSIGIFDNQLYFSGTDGNNHMQLYSYHLSNKNVTQIATINPGGDSKPAGFIHMGGEIFFTADDGMHGRELWKMRNGQQPVMVADINTNPDVDIPVANLTIYDNTLYFTAYGANGNEMYMYNDPNNVTSTTNTKTATTAYPNPVHHIVHFDLETKYPQRLSLRIINTFGQVVYTGQQTIYSTGKHTIKADLKHLPGGQYYYHITNAQEQTFSGGIITKL